jgi:TolB-like protein
VGFPFAMVISWFYELTPAGFRRETEPGDPAAAGRRRPRALRLALLCAAGLGLALAIASPLVSRQDSPPAPAAASIAVLPFRNLSTSADNAYFAEGIQEEILSRLTRLGALRIIARSSTARYTSAPDDLPKIGRELGVENILEGSVQRNEDEVRISVQLVRASNNANLWSETYDRKLSDIFGVESEVAKAIAGSLKATLSGTEQRDLDSKPTLDAQAYEQYLRGVALYMRSFQPSNLLGAADHFRHAVQLDPGFAKAWALLAQADANIAYQVMATPGLCDKAGQEAATALRLAPTLGQAHRAQGYYLFACKNDLDGAQRAFEQAQLELPGDNSLLQALGDVERRRGALEKAADYMRRATALDPRNTTLLGDYALTLAELRRFDQAHAVADQVLNLIPDEHAMLGLQAYTLQAQGRLEDAGRLLAPLASDPRDSAIFEYQVLQQLYQRQPAAAIALLQPALAQDLSSSGIGTGDYWYLLGVAQRAAGDQAAARKAFADGHAYLMRLAAAAQSPDTELYLNSLLCLFDAGSGDEAAAQRECAPVASAAGSGGLLAPAAREALARADALRGRTEAVTAVLPELLRASYYSNIYSAPLTPALLRQDPVWDSLRADPRFRNLAGPAG